MKTALILSPLFSCVTAFATIHSNERLLSTTSTTTIKMTKDDAAAYNDYTSAAVDLSDAHVTGRIFSVTRSVRDIDNDKRRKFMYSFVLPKDKDSDDTPVAMPPVELHDSIQYRLPSPSGRKIAILRNEDKATDNNKQPNQILEIWMNENEQQQYTLSNRIALSSHHGKVITNAGGFGIPSWNADESALVYSAECKTPETKSFFDTTDKDSKSKKIRGGQFTLGLGKSENWGEKYFAQQPLLNLYLVHIETGKIGQVQNVPTGQIDGDEKDVNKTTLNGYTLGQPVFSPSQNSIVYTAWDAGGGGEMPKRLGLIYCIQRPSALYESSIANLYQKLASNDDDGVDSDASDPVDKDYVKLTEGYRMSESPRFSPTSKQLLFLSTGSKKEGFDTHFGCYALHAMDWNDDSGKVNIESHRILVDQVWNPADSSADVGKVGGLGFPGLFLLELPSSGFVPSTDYLLTTTQWGSSQKVVRISTKDGSVALLNCGNEDTDSACSSDELLCITPNGSAMISTKGPNAPASVMCIPFEEICNASDKKAQSSSVARFHSIAASRFSPVQSQLDAQFTVELITTNAQSVPGVEFNEPIQSLLLMPKQSHHPGKPRLIVVLHGGPHGVSGSIYLPSYAYLCGHGGYAILMVNYRGSIGFGQASIESLPGHIGTLDIQDVVAATMQLKESGRVDPDKIGLCGGSHGGFLTAHGTSQYPDLFQAAVMRNPVVNLPSMVTVSDIPDWVYVEGTGKPYHWNDYRPANKDEIQQFWEVSPVKHIHNVKTPTLIALGLKDLRVPPSQGLEWYHTLRSKGVPTKLLTYENDDHAIDTVVSEADHWINIKEWFDQYLL